METQNLKKRRRHVDAIRERPREYEVTIQVPNVLKKEWKKYAHTHIKTLVSFLLLFIFAPAVSLIYFYKATAETTLFYPTSCLGGWNNPTNAQGEPDLSSKAQPNDFTTSNSASLSNTVSGQLFCGSFKGSIPVNSIPQKVSLKFSWTVKDPAPIVVPSVIPIIDPVIDPASTASSTGIIVPVLEYILPPDTIPVDNTPHIVVPEVSSSSSPTSFIPSLKKFFTNTVKVAYADELSIEATNTPKINSDKTSTTTLPGITTEIATSTPPAPIEDLLEISYSLNGQDWVFLGRVNRDMFSNTSFDIATTSLLGWEDLSHLQIRVERLTTLDQRQIYIDALWLEIVPAPSQELIQSQQEEYRNHLPEKNLHIINMLNSQTGGHPIIKISSNINADKKEDLVIKAKQDSSIKVYSDSDPGFFSIVGVGNSDINMPAYTFLPGNYTIIDTGEPNACQSMTVKECIADKDFLGLSRFSIVDLDLQ